MKLRILIFRVNGDMSEIQNEIKHFLKNLVPHIYQLFLKKNLPPRFKLVLFSLISKIYMITNQKRMLVDLIILTINQIFSRGLPNHIITYKIACKVCLLYYKMRNMDEIRTSGSFTMIAKTYIYNLMDVVGSVTYVNCNADLCLIGVTLASCMSDEYFVNMNLELIFHGLNLGLDNFVMYTSEDLNKINLKFILASVIKVSRCCNLNGRVKNEIDTLTFTNCTRFVFKLFSFCYKALEQNTITDPWRDSFGLYCLKFVWILFKIFLKEHHSLLNLPFLSSQAVEVIKKLLCCIYYPVGNEFNSFLIPIISTILKTIREKKDQFLDHPYSIRRQLYLNRESIFVYKDHIEELELLSDDFIHMEFEGFDEEFYCNSPTEFLDDITGRLMIRPVKTNCCNLCIDESEYVQHALEKQLNCQDYSAERLNDLADEIYLWKSLEVDAYFKEVDKC